MDRILTMRTNLANQFAEAGAKLLDFTMTAGALAAIPNTEPQQFAVAGTLDSIARVLPRAEPSQPQRRMKHGERPAPSSLDWNDATDRAAEAAQPASTDLQQLKALALAATPGKWEHTDRTVYVLEHARWHKGFEQMRNRFSCTMSHDGSGIPQKELSANAAYIAAASPAVVLDLIARIESAAAPASCATCGGSRVDPGGLPMCRDCAPVPAADDLPLPVLKFLRWGEKGSSAETISVEALAALPENGTKLYTEAQLSAAVSAATKPTADLSIEGVDFHNLLRACVMYSDDYPTRSARLIAYIKQWGASLLATKPAAAPAPPALLDHAHAEPIAEAGPEECWSRDEEDFNCQSLGDLLGTHDDLKPGDTVWYGEAVHPDAAQMVNVDSIIENIGEAAYDIGGEHAEDYPDVTEEQSKELERLVADWLNRSCQTTFWTVTNVKPYVLSADDFPHDRTPLHAEFAAQPNIQEAGNA